MGRGNEKFELVILASRGVVALFLRVKKSNILKCLNWMM